MEFLYASHMNQLTFDEQHREEFMLQYMRQIVRISLTAD